jgi:hypothetical protein
MAGAGELEENCRTVQSVGLYLAKRFKTTIQVLRNDLKLG